jgi:C-terminal processing protease CtpA/Prc
MSFLAHTDALIIDLRRNGGGEPAMIAYVLSYLFDEPTHLNDIYERVGDKTQQWWTMPHVPGQRFGAKKPVYVLTSRTTFSGGEEFAYNLKNLKRATLIGETTGGGAHPVRAVKVSQHFAIGVPFARAISPITRTNWEGTGVTPDVPKPADQALDTAYVMALEKIVEMTDNPRQKEQLQGLLNQRKKN